MFWRWYFGLELVCRLTAETFCTCQETILGHQQTVLLCTFWKRKIQPALSKMENLTLHGNSSTSHSSDNPALVSRTVYTTVAVIMGVFSVAGIILNVLVIVVTVRHRQLRQPLSYALVNLAVCDLGCATFGGLPTTVTSAMGYFCLGRLGCILEGFFMSFFGKSISGLSGLFFVK